MNALIGIGVVLTCIVFIITADPGAKLWLAETIDALSLRMVRELTARATAQTAARKAWKLAYATAKHEGSNVIQLRKVE